MHLVVNRHSVLVEMAVRMTTIRPLYGDIDGKLDEAEQAFYTFNILLQHVNV